MDPDIEELLDADDGEEIFNDMAPTTREVTILTLDEYIVGGSALTPRAGKCLAIDNVAQALRIGLLRLSWRHFRLGTADVAGLSTRWVASR